MSSKTLETLRDRCGSVIALPMKRKNRRQWIIENINKLFYLDFLLIERNGYLHKLPLENYKKRYEETIF